MIPIEGLSCPLPESSTNNRISLAHGEGARLTRSLIANHILRHLGNSFQEDLNDATILPHTTGQLAMTTDSYVVSPLFFEGGDIGSLAVNGTVNDLAVTGATPRWLSLSFILEEGLPLETLDRVMASIANAGSSAGIEIVTGDTKVVPRGAADGMFINTTGIGEYVTPPFPGPQSLSVGDALIISGPIAQHGMAILAGREEFQIEPPIRSDCRPLSNAITNIKSSRGSIRCIRDATRGGVGAVLHEWAESSNLSLTIHESEIPVSDDVLNACELFGLDPIHVACEGTIVIAAEAGHTKTIIQELRDSNQALDPKVVGIVSERKLAPVLVERAVGAIPLDEPLGAPLPRIC